MSLPYPDPDYDGYLGGRAGWIEPTTGTIMFAGNVGSCSPYSKHCPGFSTVLTVNSNWWCDHAGEWACRHGHYERKRPAGPIGCSICGQGSNSIVSAQILLTEYGLLDPEWRER